MKKPLNNDFNHSKSISLRFVTFILLIFSLCGSSLVFCQTEVMAWGNITGIRVEGELMEFETSLRVVKNNWSDVSSTAKERFRTNYHRDGNRQIVNTTFGGFQFSEIVTESGPGKATAEITIASLKDTLAAISYFCIDLPPVYDSRSVLQFEKATRSGITLSDVTDATYQKPLALKATGLKIATQSRQLQIRFSEQKAVFVRKENGHVVLYIALTGKEIKKGKEAKAVFAIIAAGAIDQAPVTVTVNSDEPGNRFAGFGGNFRLQNPKLDPEVIQYCLNNMRVAWGRVEMPWQLWHADENTDPVEAANEGKLNDHVRKSMEMARNLAQRGIPVILSDWAAPDWAIIGEQADAYRYRSKGIFGYPLNPEKTEKIYKSITDYLVYLKAHYGVEPVLFSFNESDLGINVRHTGEEHAAFIKGIGSYFAGRGIKTKLLLGDNSDATTFDFILPAMKDPSVHPYIGAISFHSWRGCDDATLQKWAGAARQMNLPLIVAEGSTDAAAWNYPEIFFEQPFALYEINLYMRLCSLCQPLSILQWQLTSDYSPLAGNGIFGTDGPLRPTRRFWNLKQLAATPADAFSLPVTSSHSSVNSAAFGNIACGEYVIHMVNNGAERKVLIKGLPDSVSSVIMFVTDETKGMEKTGEWQVQNGTVDVTLPPAAFVSLFTK